MKASWIWIGTLLLGLGIGPLAGQEAPELDLSKLPVDEQANSPNERNIEDPLDDLAPHEPDDGVWLVDDEGREYFLRKIPNNPRTYKWIERGETIRYKKWFKLEVARHDDDFLWIKRYKPQDPGMRQSPEQKDAERRAAAAEAAAAYAFDKPAPADELRFEPWGKGLPREQPWRQGFDFADMNGDGYLDLVHGPSRKGAQVPWIFLGDGKGNWTVWRDVKYPQIDYDYGDVAVADFDGNGLQDMAFGVHLRGVVALLQTSPGVFEVSAKGLSWQTPGEGQGVGGFSSRTLETVDWDGNGRMDFVAIGEGARSGGLVDAKRRGLPPSRSYGSIVFLYEGPEEGWARADHAGTSGVFGDSVAIGDFNADGHPDYVSSASSNAPPEILHYNVAGSVQSRLLEPNRRKALVTSAAAGDFDEDGRDDVVAVFSNRLYDISRRSVEVLLSRPEGPWKRVMVDLFAAEKQTTNIWAMTTGDVNGDGHLDLVTGDDRSNLRVYLGRGDGTLVQEESPELLSSLDGCRAYSLNLVDTDGDGRAELFANYGGGAVFSNMISELANVPSNPCPSSGGLRSWRIVASSSTGG